MRRAATCFRRIPALPADMKYNNIVIIGAGNGISGALARMAHAQGARVMLAARNTEKLGELASDTNAITMQTDADK